MTLRASGAVIFGKTTTTEFATCQRGPATCNPHDPTRTAGGSSSGSGASVGDFQVPIALGTQTGGSTIRPGSFNGIYALKPTWNSISREGLKVYSLTYDTLGLYARSVEDLKLLAKVFRLEDDVAPPAEPFQLKGAKFAFLKVRLASPSSSIALLPPPFPPTSAPPSSYPSIRYVSLTRLTPEPDSRLAEGHRGNHQRLREGQEASCGGGC